MPKAKVIRGTPSSIITRYEQPILYRDRKGRPYATKAQCIRLLERLQIASSEADSIRGVIAELL